MRNRLNFLLLCLSVHANAQVHNYAKRGHVMPRDVVTVTVTFASAPASASTAFAMFKYNKEAALSIEMDDNSVGMKILYPLFNGGTDDTGNTYVQKTFTDGCGNPVPYRAGLAVNGRNGYNNVPVSSLATDFTYDNIATIIKNDWCIENHGYYHDAGTNFNLGRNYNLNLRVNHKWWYDRMKERGVDYVIRTMVVPSGNSGYALAADSMQYIACTSQGILDGYPGYQFPTVESIPNTGFTFYGRWLGDQWGTSAQLATYNTQTDLLLSSSSPTSHKLWRWFAHGVVLPNIQTWADRLQTQANDRCWVVGLHEYQEYMEVKRLVKKTQVLAGPTLTLTLDLSRIPLQNRFRDMSLLVSGGTMKSITVAGADSYSYNASTGLINVFKKKTSGFIVFN